MRWIPTLTPRRMRQLWYAPMLALGMVLMMLRLLVMARLLDVPTFGEFSGGVLVSGTFCMLGCLGLQPMLQREWPMQLVRGEELRPVVRAIQCNLVALACFALGLVGAAAGLSVAGMSPALIAAGLVHGVSQQFFLVATVESRSRGDALRFARQNLFRAAATLGVSIAAAQLSGSALVVLLVDAVVAMTMSIAVFGGLFARIRVGPWTAAMIALRRLRRVPWRSAVELLAVMVMGFVLLNLDRWIASARLDVTEFAHYSFACVVLSIAQSAQLVVNASVYPLLARRVAQHGRQVAFGVCLRASAVFALVGVVFGVPLGLLLDLGITQWYPQYAASATLLSLFVFIAVLRVSDFWTSFLLIVGLEAWLLRLNVAAALVGILAWAAWLQPWSSGSITLRQVGWLAVAVTVFAYAAVLSACWRARRD